MKKFISLLLSLTLAVIMFTGCTSNKPMKDGTYKSEFSSEDAHGWVDYVEITVTKNKITNVVYDSLNSGKKEREKKSVKKTEDIDYYKAMVNSKCKTYPREFYTKLAQQLVDKQQINKVDKVAGATISTNDFEKLVKSLLKNMANGDISTVIVDR